MKNVTTTTTTERVGGEKPDQTHMVVMMVLGAVMVVLCLVLFCRYLLSKCREVSRRVSVPAFYSRFAGQAAKEDTESILASEELETLSTELDELAQAGEELPAEDNAALEEAAVRLASIPEALETVRDARNRMGRSRGRGAKGSGSAGSAPSRGRGKARASSASAAPARGATW